MRLNSADLPTLGRPTMAINSGMLQPHRVLQSAADIQPYSFFRWMPPPPLRNSTVLPPPFTGPWRRPCSTLPTTATGKSVLTLPPEVLRVEVKRGGSGHAYGDAAAAGREFHRAGHLRGQHGADGPTASRTVNCSLHFLDCKTAAAGADVRRSLEFSDNHRPASSRAIQGPGTADNFDATAACAQGKRAIASVSLHAAAPGFTAQSAGQARKTQTSSPVSARTSRSDRPRQCRPRPS